MKKFTLIELLLVVAIISILVSILLPSLMRAREKSKYAVCLTQKDQNYKLIMTGLMDHNQKLPRFKYHDWNQAHTTLPDYDTDDWTGAGNRKGKMVNPVAGHYYGSDDDWHRSNPLHAPPHPIQKIMRCPSLKKGKQGTPNTGTFGSNGAFDYSFPQSLGGLFVEHLDLSIQWLGNDRPTPLVLEEDPRMNMGFGKYYVETAWGNGDTLGEWHDFGRKGSYLGLGGHVVIMRTNHNTPSVMFRSSNIMIEYQGSLKSFMTYTSVDEVRGTKY